MGFTLLDGPVGCTLGLLGFQGAKPLFRPIVLAKAVSSLPVEPNMMLFSLRKSLMKQARYTRQLLTRDLFFKHSFLMFIY